MAIIIIGGLQTTSRNPISWKRYPADELANSPWEMTTAPILSNKRSLVAPRLERLHRPQLPS